MTVRRYHVDRGSITYDKLEEDTIQFVTVYNLLDEEVTVSIDSTGIKFYGGVIIIPGEAVKHVKKAYFIVSALDPSATDAVVEVELWNATDSAQVTVAKYTGTGGLQKIELSASTIKSLVDKLLRVRINVTKASATAGAYQTINGILLILVNGVS